MRLTRFFLILLTSILSLSIIIASRQASIFESFAPIMKDPWGLVAILDLYIGLIMLSIIIFFVEKKKTYAALWSIGVLLLGNIIGAIWLIIRLPLLMKDQKPDHK